MRLNKYLASATELSRRGADAAVDAGRVQINGQPANSGSQIGDEDLVTLDGQPVFVDRRLTTIMLNKPYGYVVSRDGQGSKTIYDLLSPEYQQLNPVGRLDKNSSGLMLLTNDGTLANELTHPRYAKLKIYEIRLNAPLAPLHQQMINDRGLSLEDGLSKLQLEKLDASGHAWRVTMSEGRNRQIRRTFSALDYTVTRLHRTHFGPYALGELSTGSTTQL
ncbi:MAG: pseudouridine synthase [Candidatus Saccharimonadales bacterium]